MSASAEVDVAIVGAGVVGLAIAEEISRNNSVAVIERHESYGRETSSHNSGVVHAGIYYPPGWLKTTLCVEGNRLLYEWAEQHNVRVRKTGKLVIARSEEERPALEELLVSARENGVPDLELLLQGRVEVLEPSIEATAAIYSDSSGVIDQMELMRSLETAAVERGALMAYVHDVQKVERTGTGFHLTIRDPDAEEMRLDAAVLINSAGLGADTIAGLVGYDLDGTPRLRHTINKGRYYDIVSP